MLIGMHGIWVDALFLRRIMEKRGETSSLPVNSSWIKEHMLDMQQHPCPIGGIILLMTNLQWVQKTGCQWEACWSLGCLKKQDAWRDKRKSGGDLSWQLQGGAQRHGRAPEGQVGGHTLVSSLCVFPL